MDLNNILNSSDSIKTSIKNLFGSDVEFSRNNKRLYIKNEHLLYTMSIYPINDMAIYDDETIFEIKYHLSTNIPCIQHYIIYKDKIKIIDTEHEQSIEINNTDFDECVFTYNIYLSNIYNINYNLINVCISLQKLYIRLKNITNYLSFSNIIGCHRLHVYQMEHTSNNLKNELFKIMNNELSKIMSEYLEGIQ